MPSTRKLLESVSLCLAIGLFASCTGPAMRGQFRNYNTAYAKALNEQMLLNLARLENGHPAYYLAIGTINDSFDFNAQANVGTSGSPGSGTSSRNVFDLMSRTIGRVNSAIFGPAFSGSVSGSSSPEFQFIPVNNEVVATQVLKPVPIDVFSTLYLQGYPIDQLMRVLIERIETTLPNKEAVVLINSPTRGPMESYARFLRTCAILRELQRRGELLLETRSDFNATTQTFSDSSPEKTSGQKQNQPDEKPAVARATNAVTEASQEVMPTFYLRHDRVNPLLAQFSKEGKFDMEAVTNVITLLNTGITIKTELANRGQARTRLVLRSFDRAMEAVASEQAAFELLMKETNFVAFVPPSEQRPILQIIWRDKNLHLAPALQTIHYAGKTYQVTDEMKNALDPTARWNRDVFRLMVALGSQVTVDISKFQRQVFELRTD